jgi:putative sigma-54 modulation protein
VEITVSSRHTEVSEALRASTIEKIGRLSRFLEGMDRAEVHFSEHRNKRNADKEVCEVTLEGHGHHVRCKVSARDGFAAVDLAVEKLEHQLHKLKTKLMKSKRTNEVNRRAEARSRPLEADALLSSDGVATALLDGDEDDDGDGSRGAPRIVKSKRFTIKPMTPDEAVLQMDLLGHDFFFFTNADTELAAVIYRRSDGDVGLIDEA